MATILWIFLLNFFLLTRFAFLSPIHLDRVIKSVDKLVDFYKTNYRDLNVDGLFGLRVIEGHLFNILEVYANSSLVIDPSVLDKLKAMKTVSTDISNKAIEFVKKDDEMYYKSMQFIVGNPWTLHKDYKPLQFQLLWDPTVYTSKMKLNEQSSDKCMMEIMGYQPSKTKCEVSHFCRELMTSKGMTGYGITHQILWTMLSEQAGCKKEMSDMLTSNGKGQTENLQLELCTNNYLEMMQIVHGTLKGQVIPRFQDLFMEQQFICPSLGFYQFLSDDFLDQIISWQKESGCYGTMKKPTDKQTKLSAIMPKEYQYEDDPTVLKFKSLMGRNQTASHKSSLDIQPPVLNIKSESSKNLGSVQMTNNMVMQRGSSLVAHSNDNINSFLQRNTKKLTAVKSFLGSQRRLLSEKELDGGCLAHKTSVAAGALMIYLRYLIIPGPKSLAENTKDMLQQRHLLNIKDSDNTNQGAKPGSVGKGHAMNNNALAAQINNDDYKDDDYYADDNDENEEEDDGNGDNKNVQFDDHQDEDGNNNDKDYEGDYNENETGSKKNLHVKTLADKDKNVPKPDDTDYTYYEDKNKHDDYNNEEYEDKDENKDSSNKIKVKLMNESQTGQTYSPSSTQSPYGVFLIVSLTVFVLLVLLYRFLKKRRVHIRYNYKSFNRV